MIVIGTVLLVLAALGVAAAVVSGRDTRVTVDGFGVHLTTSVLWVFCAGALAMLLLLLALSAFRRALRRRRNRRRELKALRKEEEAAARERRSDGTVGGAAAPPTPVAGAGTSADSGSPPAGSGSAEGAAHRIDLTHATSAADDPGPERRYVPGDDPR